MFIAENKDGKRISTFSNDKINFEISRKDDYFCPLCKEKVIYKCGKINLPHFAHQKKSQCKNSNHLDILWKSFWQKTVPKDSLEVLFEDYSTFNEKYIADIYHNKSVLLLEDKSLKHDDFIDKTIFFAGQKGFNLVWLFDLRYKNIKLDKIYRNNNKKDFYIFRWYHYCRFFDINYKAFQEECRIKFDLFFQINSKQIIHVNWNKDNSFKYFGGYVYNLKDFQIFINNIF